MDAVDSWYHAARVLLPRDVDVWDGHTHTGVNDPDGVSGTASRLIEKLDAVEHAGAVVTTSQDPSGYRLANDRVLREAIASDGRLVPFLRVDPRLGVEATKEVERSLDAGHRGIKLHPRAEAFRLGEPTVLRVAAIAAERSVPMLVHAGRGILSLGQDAVSLCDRFPDLRLILAHAALSDLSWLGPVVAEHPGLYFDTAWWDVTDLLALVAWVPPERIVYASDTPYGHPALGFTLTMRVAAAAGYTSEQLGAVFGGTLLGLLGEQDEATPTASQSGPVTFASDPGLVRVHASLHGAIALAFAGANTDEAVALARLGCVVAADAPDASVYRAIAATLDAVDFTADGRSHVIRPLIIAACAALTPSVPVPVDLLE